MPTRFLIMPAVTLATLLSLLAAVGCGTTPSGGIPVTTSGDTVVDVEHGETAGIGDTTTQGDTGACTPLCAGKECGPDGCGGLCGTCDQGVCASGVCQDSCPSGLMSCGGLCVDTASDPDHCGGCGDPCQIPGAEATCIDGTCRFVACVGGHLDANASHDDGCEVTCDGLEVTASGSLLFDIPTIALDGVVLVDGSPHDFGGASTATIHIVDRATGFDAVMLTPGDLGTGGAYSRRIVPGTYDLVYHDPVCSSEAPCPSKLLYDGIALTTDGAVTFDVPSVTIDGTITVGGAPLDITPDTQTRIVIDPVGALDGSTAAVFVSLAALTGGGATYSREVVPGHYALTYLVDVCEEDVPCPVYELFDDVALTADGALNMDIPLVTIDGLVTLDGAPYDATAGNGQEVVVIEEPTSSHAAVFLGLQGGLDTGSAYTRHVVPGTYDLTYRTDWCTTDTPCPEARIHESISLTAAGGLDLVLETIPLSGKVTVAGAPLGAIEATGDAGISISAVGSDHSARMLALPGDLEPTGTYERRIVPGTYTITYGESHCNELLPCPSYVVYDSVELTAGGALELAIPAVELAGKVTFGGEAITATSAGQGGHLVIRATGTTQEAVFISSEELVEDGGIYSRLVVPGTYDFLYRATTCDEHTPCPETFLLAGMEVTVDGAVNLDVPYVDVTTGITADGIPLDETAALGMERMMVGPSILGDGGVLLLVADHASDLVPREIIPGTWFFTYRVDVCSEDLPCPLSILAGCD